MEKLAKEVRILKIYAISLTAVCILFFFFAFKHQNSHQRFDEIDVERINIIEKDGTVKMVISNKKRQHNGMVNNKEFNPREREAGLIFFNELGDECGGLYMERIKMGPEWYIPWIREIQTRLCSSSIWKEPVTKRTEPTGLSFGTDLMTFLWKIL